MFNGLSSMMHSGHRSNTEPLAIVDASFIIGIIAVGTLLACGVLLFRLRGTMVRDHRADSEMGRAKFMPLVSDASWKDGQSPTLTPLAKRRKGKTIQKIPAPRLSSFPSFSSRGTPVISSARLPYPKAGLPHTPRLDISIIHPPPAAQVKPLDWPIYRKPSKFFPSLNSNSYSSQPTPMGRAAVDPPFPLRSIRRPLSKHAWSDASSILENVLAYDGFGRNQ